MYKSILKKDLKRKKIMNIILLMFITISVVFVSSSTANIFAVTNSLDTYFDKAGVPDYLVIERDKGEGPHTDYYIKDLECIESYSSEDIIYVSNIKFNNKNVDKNDVAIMSNIDSKIGRFYNENDEEITSVKGDEVYFRKNTMEQMGAKVGEKITLVVGEIQKEFTIKGVLKDAVFGGSLMGTPRFIVSDEAFKYFENSKSISKDSGKIFFINTTDKDKVTKSISECTHLVFDADKSMIKLSYLMEIILAAILTVVSLCLIAIALVILKFTISFTLSEEYREIGIMKAIGIHNTKIRGLYMVKYLAIAIIGMVVGYLISIPFAQMMLSQASVNIIISSSGNFILSMLASLLLVGIVMLFSFRCTKKVNKFSPVDAIRNGSTGERYRKKGFLKLYKTKSRPILFMSINDIFSDIKKFGIMFVTFLIGILLITVVTNTTYTLQNPKIVSLFSQQECDAYISPSNGMMNNDYCITGGKDKMARDMAYIEQKLASRDMKVKVFVELAFKLNVVNKNNDSYSVRCYQGVNTDINDYEYLEGSAPINKNEISITKITADKFGVRIGDTLTVEMDNVKKDYIITSYFQTMNNIGEGIRFNDRENIDYAYLAGIFDFEIKYLDDLSNDEKANRNGEINELLPDYKVIEPQKQVANYLGGITDNLESIRNFVVIIVVLINVLVSILMAKSFITKERGQIAMLKAIGFKDSSIIMWQVIRIGIVDFLAIVFGVLLTNPVSQITTGLIFKMMGAESIVFVNDVINAYIIFPLIVLIVTIISVIFTALSIRNIKTSEINSIE